MEDVTQNYNALFVLLFLEDFLRWVIFPSFRRNAQLAFHATIILVNIIFAYSFSRQSFIGCNEHLDVALGFIYCCFVGGMFAIVYIY